MPVLDAFSASEAAIRTSVGVDVEKHWDHLSERVRTLIGRGAREKEFNNRTLTKEFMVGKEMLSSR